MRQALRRVVFSSIAGPPVLRSTTEIQLSEGPDGQTQVRYSVSHESGGFSQEARDGVRLLAREAINTHLDDVLNRPRVATSSDPTGSVSGDS
jgi:hypothetical protein